MDNRRVEMDNWRVVMDSRRVVMDIWRVEMTHISEFQLFLPYLLPPKVMFGLKKQEL